MSDADLPASQLLNDPIFAAHDQGKIEVALKAPIRDRDDLSRVYTPGVAAVCLDIVEHPSHVRDFTMKANTIAVVTDGSAVLGLGNLGPEGALPVMEGKAALFKQFGDINAVPLCLDTQDVDEIVRTVQVLAPGFAGINLEDISAPRCFDIEARLRQLLDIPVFHDDQHGTAIVAYAALINALKVVGKRLADVRIVIAGAGAAGTAILRLLQAEGASDIVVCTSRGALGPNGSDTRPQYRHIAETTNPRGVTGTLAEVVRDADVFIGVSGPNVLTGDDIATMAAQPIVFAMANPTPEVDPQAALEHAAVMATGRSDYPNQINNVLAFPGVFRGLLDARSNAITDEMIRAAAHALAQVVPPQQLAPDFIIPSVFDPAVCPAVAQAVRDTATSTGQVAQR